MDFGKRLKELRIKARLTQKQLADQLGVSKSVVSFYELRERTPSPDVLIKLAAIFHDISGLDSDDEKIVRLMVETLRRKNMSISDSQK